MYLVFQLGMVQHSFDMFVDAWLFASLELRSHSIIVGPDGRWRVDPLHDPSKPTIH
jgi:hypothetical protein